MKRVLCLLLILLSLLQTAQAAEEIYIANPDPADRLHLRKGPNRSSESLAKYYNGAPVAYLGVEDNGWMKIDVGIGAAKQTGYMLATYLSSKPSKSAMPQYITCKPVKGYHHPNLTAQSVTIAGGRLLCLMGLNESWWHVMVCTGTSEGNYSCFVPAGSDDLIPLAGTRTVNIYISNPDQTDRLHLRSAPSTESRSLGKYYNGCVGTLKGFTEDGEWLHVELYGRTGYMKSGYVYIEGQGPNPTYYGIPTVQTRSAATLYHDVTLTRRLQSISTATKIEVLGIVNQQILQVRFGDRVGYIKWNAVDYVDPK